MVAVVVALATGAYMAYQHYYGSKAEVKIQRGIIMTGGGAGTENTY